MEATSATARTTRVSLRTTKSAFVIMTNADGGALLIGKLAPELARQVIMPQSRHIWDYVQLPFASKEIDP